MSAKAPMLEEYDKIDTIAKSDDGSMQLVIMDAGLTENPDERYDHLMNKLRTYVAFATSSKFQEKYPGVTPERISFLVMCRIPPTEKMEKTTTIARADNPSEHFQITYRHFPGADGNAEDAPTPVVRNTKPIGKVDTPSNVPVHITFGFLFLYIAATRYLIYFGPARELHSFNEAQALGASLGYLFVWSFAYWFCATSPRKTWVTWLGGSAVILSTLIGPFVGFILLFVIYFLRKKQKKQSLITSLAKIQNVSRGSTHDS